MSDELYTPQWIFDAMGVHFDLDVAAPPFRTHVPASRFYTESVDGLGQDWDGIVWCNPPYSRFTDWAVRWTTHDRGALLGFYAPESRAAREVFRQSEYVTFISAKFERLDGPPMKPRHGLFVAFRGMGDEPAMRLAAADRFGAVLEGASDGKK